MWLNVCSWVTTGLLTPCGSLISLPWDIIYFLPLPVCTVILLLCVIPWSLVGEHLECTSVCGHVHVAARAQSLMTFLKCFPPHLQTPSFTGLELTDLLRWMTSKPQGSPCVSLPHTGITNMLCHVFFSFFPFFWWVLEIKVRSCAFTSQSWIHPLNPLLPLLPDLLTFGI